MAITTRAGVLAGLQPPMRHIKPSIAPNAGFLFSTFPVGGVPATGTTNATINGATYTGQKKTSGVLFRPNPPTGMNAYVAGMTAFGNLSSQPKQYSGFLHLCDRLWDGRLTINSNSAQSITTPTWPARDKLGGTSGVGVELALEVSAVTSATAAVAAVTYTNEAGVGSRTATLSYGIPTTSTATAGSWFPFDLQAGDLGVQSVQSITFSTPWTSGTVNLVAYVPLSRIDMRGDFSNATLNDVQTGLPRVYDDAHLFFVGAANGIVGNYGGSVTETWG